jgi:hypothetical protein
MSATALGLKLGGSSEQGRVRSLASEVRELAGGGHISGLAEVRHDHACPGQPGNSQKPGVQGGDAWGGQGVGSNLWPQAC